MNPQTEIAIQNVRFHASRIFSNIRTRNPKFKQTPSWIDQNSLVQLRNEGYVALPAFYTNEWCARMVANLDEVLAKNQYAVQKFPGNDSRIFGIEKFSDRARNFAEQKELLELACWYLKTNVRNFQTLGARLGKSNDGLGSGGSWHRDSNAPQFKCMVYLTDVSDSHHGAFELIPRSHRFSMVRSSIRKRSSSSSSTRWDESEMVGSLSREKITISGAAGTVLCFDSSLLHRGSPLSIGVRYALTNYYYPKFVSNDLLQSKFFGN